MSKQQHRKSTKARSAEKASKKPGAKRSGDVVPAEEPDPEAVEPAFGSSTNSPAPPTQVPAAKPTEQAPGSPMASTTESTQAPESATVDGEPNVDGEDNSFAIE